MLDYYFSPNGWNTTWNCFLTNILPNLVKTGILSNTGSVWIPGWPETIEILANTASIKENYDVYWVHKEDHPLWVASEKAKPVLVKIKVMSFTNEWEWSKNGFFRLIPKSTIDIGIVDALVTLRQIIGTGDQVVQTLCGILKVNQDVDNRKRKLEQVEVTSPPTIRKGTSGHFDVRDDGRMILEYVVDLVDGDDET